LFAHNPDGKNSAGWHEANLHALRSGGETGKRTDMNWRQNVLLAEMTADGAKHIAA